jgi:hypothetical protein
LWSHLPQDVPDEIVGLVTQIEKLRATFGGQGGPSVPVSPQNAPSQQAQQTTTSPQGQPVPPGQNGNVMPNHPAQAALNQQTQQQNQPKPPV